VKVEETGQDALWGAYLIQVQGKEYQSVWPDEHATAKLEWPMKGWKK